MGRRCSSSQSSLVEYRGLRQHRHEEGCHELVGVENNETTVRHRGGYIAYQKNFQYPVDPLRPKGEEEPHDAKKEARRLLKDSAEVTTSRRRDPGAIRRRPGG